MKYLIVVEWTQLTPSVYTFDTQEHSLKLFEEYKRFTNINRMTLFAVSEIGLCREILTVVQP